MVLEATKISSHTQFARTIQTEVIHSTVSKCGGPARKKKRPKLPSTDSIPTRRNQHTLSESSDLGGSLKQEITDINSLKTVVF